MCIIFMQNLIMNKISYNKKIFYTAVQLHPCYCTKKVCRFVPKKIIARGKNICHYKICGVKQQKKVCCGWKQFFNVTISCWHQIQRRRLWWWQDPSPYFRICQLRPFGGSNWQRSIHRLIYYLAILNIMLLCIKLCFNHFLDY